MNPLQSNTQEGLVVKVAGANLTGKENYFATVNSDGEAVLAGDGALALFIVEDGGAEGANVTLRPLHANRQFRIKTGADISAAGEVSCDTNGAAQPADSGDFVLGIAEADADASDGVYTLIRPVVYKKA